MQKNLSKPFLTLLSLPCTAMGFALSVQISVLSWILATKYNLNIQEVGWVWLSGPVAGIIGQMAAGIISDKIWFLGGRRRPFIVIGGALTAAMLFCLPQLDVISNSIGISNILIIALLVALTLDIAINISFNPTRSIIADVTQVGEQRTQAFTWMQFISGFFGVLAYFIGLILGKYFLIYFGVGLVLAFSLIPPFFISEPKDLDAVNEEGEKEHEQLFVSPIQMGLIYVAHGFSWLGIQTMFVFIYVYIQSVIGVESSEATGRVIDLSFLVMQTVGFLLPVFVLLPIAKEIGNVRTHTLSIFIMAIGYLLILFLGKSSLSLALMMLIVGVGWASVVSLPFAIFTDRVDPKRMGYYMGIFNLSVVIPQIIVSAFFGTIIANAADKNIIFMICAGMLFVSGILWLLVKND